jgi:hypothetical protein
LAYHLVLNCFINRLTRKNRIGEKTMKTMKAVCATTVLALTLSVSAFAGDISSPGVALPGPGTVSTAPSTLSTDTTVVVRDLETGAFCDMLLTLMSMF